VEKAGNPKMKRGGSGEFQTEPGKGRPHTQEKERDRATRQVRRPRGKICHSGLLRKNVTKRGVGPQRETESGKKSEKQGGGKKLLDTGRFAKSRRN